MKKLFFYIILFSSHISLSQYINYKDDTGWNLGFNIGGTWQESEQYLKGNDTVFSNPFSGYSRGFTFGKSVFEEENHFFSFDFRFRFLRGENSGWTVIADSFADPNGIYGFPIFNDDSVYAYHNYQMKFSEYTFEGVLTLNKLRNKTGILIYGFGGIGLTYYDINRDVLNGTSDDIFSTGYPYDYSNLTFFNDRQRAIELKNLSDGHFETEIQKNKLKFMPSLGFGFGYQINSHWSLGIEYKTTFALKNNINDIDNAEFNDKYHYTALKINFDLNSKEHAETISKSNNNNSEIYNYYSNPNNPRGQTPIVERINPQITNYNWNFPTIQFSNSIQNLSDEDDNENYNVKNDITKIFKLNGDAYKRSRNEFILTQNIQTQAGSAFTNQKIDFTKDFNFKFEAYLGNFDNAGADGLAIVFHNDPMGVYAKGLNGKYLGAGGIENGLVLEIDTYFNPDVDLFSKDHTSIWASNQIENKLSQDIAFSNLEDGNWHIIEIKWNVSSQTLDFSLDGALAGKIEGDIVNQYFGGISSVYYGYTASTGYYYNIHKVRFNDFNLNSLNRIIDKDQLSRKDIEFTVNGFKSYNYIFENKILTSTINLKPGINIIKVKGINSLGSDSKTTTIVYNPPPKLRPPSVNITVPNSSDQSTYSPFTSIHATILNMENNNGIIFKINGERNYNFSFNGNIFIAPNLPLKIGNNIFEIIASNFHGQDQDQTTVEYVKEFAKPDVNITKPIKNPFATNKRTAIIKATILNVTNRNDVLFFLNGNLNSGFEIINNEFISKEVALKQGSNHIKIIASNNQGSSFDETIIVFKPNELPKPKVNFTKPSENIFDTKNRYYSFNAEILNVSGINNITFSVNGDYKTSFTKNGNDFRAQNIALKEGENIIILKGQNNQGFDSDKVIVNYKPKEQNISTVIEKIKKPKITINTPHLNPFETNSISQTVKAIVTNVERENISMSINDKPIYNFQYSNHFLICENLVLNDGNNEIVVKGENEHGTAIDQTVIIYEKPIANSTNSNKTPVINFTYPTTSTFETNKKMILLKGTIRHVDNYNDIAVKMNGSSVKNFLFDTYFNDFECEIQLQNGSNHFKITATNSRGKDEKSVNLIYSSEECDNPIIQLNSPSNNNVTVSNSRAYISANIIHTQNVNLKINGVDSQGYNFNVNNGEFSSILNLNPGTHNYEIIAWNTCGTVVESITFNYSNNNVDLENRDNNFKSEENKENIIKKEEEKILELKRKKL